jgi:hypothetical protein
MLGRFTLKEKRSVKKQTFQEDTQWQLPEPPGEGIPEAEFEDEHDIRERESGNDYEKIITLDDNEFGKY